MLDISVDTGFFEAQKDIYGATVKQFDLARYRALKKLNKHIETDLKREAARKLRIPVKSIGDRFFSKRIEPGDDELRVWVGLWNVSPYSIGNPQQKKKSVRAGRRSYPGAFLGRIYSGTEKVWIRLHSKHYSPELYPTIYRAGDRGLGDLRGRFPVVRAAVPIDGVLGDLIAVKGDQYSAKFEEIFVRELNYETQVKGKL